MPNSVIERLIEIHTKKIADAKVKIAALQSGLDYMEQCLEKEKAELAAQKK